MYMRVTPGASATAGGGPRRINRSREARPLFTAMSNQDLPGWTSNNRSQGLRLSGERSQRFQNRLARTGLVGGELAEQRQCLFPAGRKRRQQGVVERRGFGEPVLEGQSATQRWHGLE